LYAEHVISLLVRNVTRVTLLKTLVKKKGGCRSKVCYGKWTYYIKLQTGGEPCQRLARKKFCNLTQPCTCVTL